MDKDDETSLSTEKLRFSKGLLGIFQNAPKIEKEFLSQTFLLGLTFFRLAIMRCPRSSSIVKNYRNFNGKYT